MLIDTHFHLDLMDNMQFLIREFKKADIGAIAVGTTPKAYCQEKQFCAGVENIKVALGLHPQLISERGQEIELFLDMVKVGKYIGEIGLDFNSDYISSKDQQLFCFRKIAKVCADEGGKVLSIHSLKAARTVTDELLEAGTFINNICIFHWFSGSTSDRRKAIDAGAWFSINPKMLKTKRGQETIIDLPAERMLLETDAPFTMKVNSVNTLKMELDRMLAEITAIRHENVREIIEHNSFTIWNR